MSKTKERKEKLFSIYSTNLNIIKERLGVNFGENDINHNYVCPLSFNLYSIQGISDKYDDQLTEEHVPPKSLNGKVSCLTSKIFNSSSGHELDFKLLNHINWLELNEGIGSYKTKFKFDNGVNLKAEISYPNKENIEIKFKLKTLHQGAMKVISKLQEKGEINTEFFLPNNRGIRKINIALLRSAYLLAFSRLGYSLLLGGSKIVNQNIQKVRKQIQFPDRKIIEKIPVFNEDFPDEMLGVSIIVSPKKMRGIFVVFDLEITRKWRFGVLLPGPDDYGFKSYNYTIDKLLNENTVNFKFQSINQLDLTEVKDSLTFWETWERNHGWERS